MYPSRLSNRAVEAGRASLFVVLLVLSVLLLAAATLIAASPGDDGRPGASSPLFYALMAANGVIVAGLCAAAVTRIARQLFSRRSRDPAPRLQLRFVMLFGFAAVLPAVVMAAFFWVVLGRGVEFWLGEPVQTMVESTADVAREQARQQLADVQPDLVAMVRDISQPEVVEGLSANRIRFVTYLREQAALRGFAAAYVIDRRSTVLARAESAGSPPFAAPTGRLWSLVEDNSIGASDPVQRADDRNYVRLLARLPAYEDAYLYVTWYTDFSLLTAAEEALVSYRASIERQEQARVAFGMVYGQAALLIIAGAIWLAIGAANNVVRPVGRLVSAAERMRRGDLDVRVEVARDHDEIAALGRAFNRMARQLGVQRTALLEASEDAERRRAFIETVLAGVSAGVVGVDGEGRITLVNRSAAQLLGAAAADLTGADADAVAPVFAAVLEEARRRPAEMAERQIDLVKDDGAILHLNARAAAGEDGGIVLTFDDVTRLVAAQRNAAWRDVARRIAHEIKNPLTPIQLSAERLRRKYRGSVDEAQLDTFDRCVDTIVRQVSDIGRMVDEFSSFARMPAPRMEAADLGEIAQSAVFAQRVASPAIRVSLDRPQEPAVVECDSRLSGQALANILKNAAESVSARMESDGAKTTGQIDVSVRLEDDFAVIEVTDDGLGWPTPDRNRLTEPYMTTREKGTGLGLAIVRRIMEDHGGRLELDERRDAAPGAVVRLAFPLLNADGDLAAESSALEV